MVQSVLHHLRAQCWAGISPTVLSRLAGSEACPKALEGRRNSRSAAWEGIDRASPWICAAQLAGWLAAVPALPRVASTSGKNNL